METAMPVQTRAQARRACVQVQPAAVPEMAPKRAPLPPPWNENNCSICFETMHWPLQLQCGHRFHISCLKEWKAHQAVCPLCRGPLRPSPSCTIVGRLALVLCVLRCLGGAP